MDQLILYIAKKLAFAHNQSKNKTMDEVWNSLSERRDWNNPYCVAQDEYIRMAEAVYNMYHRED